MITDDLLRINFPFRKATSTTGRIDLDTTNKWTVRKEHLNRLTVFALIGFLVIVFCCCCLLQQRADHTLLPHTKYPEYIISILMYLPERWQRKNKLLSFFKVGMRVYSNGMVWTRAYWPWIRSNVNKFEQLYFYIYKFTFGWHWTIYAIYIGLMLIVCEKIESRRFHVLECLNERARYCE